MYCSGKFLDPMVSLMLLLSGFDVISLLSDGALVCEGSCVEEVVELPPLEDDSSSLPQAATPKASTNTNSRPRKGRNRDFIEAPILRGWDWESVAAGRRVGRPSVPSGWTDVAPG